MGKEVELGVNANGELCPLFDCDCGKCHICSRPKFVLYFDMTDGSETKVSFCTFCDSIDLNQIIRKHHG